MSHAREQFYIGGSYIKSSFGHKFHNQMYVEKLTPSTQAIHPYPIVFIHGGGQSGTSWLRKPDGGSGWASWFLNHGYEVYTIDQPNVGRSPWNPESVDCLTSFSAETLQERFTAPSKYMLWDQAKLHTRWPGTGIMGDPIFDAYFSSTLPALKNTLEQETSLQRAGIALLDKIGPAILIAHSQGGLAGWSWTDARPSLVKALVQIEPKGPPFHEVLFADGLSRPWGLTAIPLSYELPIVSMNGLDMKHSQDDPYCVLQADPARTLVAFKDISILIVTGEASYHTLYDHCFIKFLAQAGCERVEHLELGEAGIHGNGHLMFLEKNSDEIAAKLESWISRVIK